MKPTLIPYRGTSAQWFVDSTLCRIFSGHDHNRKSIAVIGPHDLSRVFLKVTSNPRQLLWALQRTTDVPLTVHEAWWSMAQGTPKVFAELMAILDRANIRPVDGWVTIAKAHVGPLLALAAEKAGIPSQRHADFHAEVLDTETAKLRAKLARANIAPDVIAAHRMV